MRITVRFFAMIREIVGRSEMALDLPAAAAAGDALNLVLMQYPAIGPYVDRMALAVNLEYVSADYSLAAGDELALIPPVSGG